MTWEEAKATWNEFEAKCKRESLGKAATEEYNRLFDSHLPTLRGTKRQIKWAGNLRWAKVNECLIMGYSENEDSMMAILWPWALSHTNAGFWINNFQEYSDRPELTKSGIEAFISAAQNAPLETRKGLKDAIMRYRRQQATEGRQKDEGLEG